MTDNRFTDWNDDNMIWTKGGPKKPMVTFKVGSKGSAKSGNYNHAGRHGLVGGSAPSNFRYPYTPVDNPKPWDQVSIAGKTGAQWKAESKAITAQREKDLMAEIENEDLDAAATDKYVNRLATHREMVLEETLRESQNWYLSRQEQAELMDNVLHHDTFDKYGKEAAVPYINKIALGGQKGGAGETKEFWKACNAHHDDNPHHPEYWADGDRAAQMPTVNLVEMIGDWKATARFFNTPQDGYYRKFGNTEFVLHPRTRQAAERGLGIDKTPFPSLYPKGFFHETAGEEQAAAARGHRSQPSLFDTEKEYHPGVLPLFGIDAVLLDTGKKRARFKGTKPQ